MWRWSTHLGWWEAFWERTHKKITGEKSHKNIFTHLFDKSILPQGPISSCAGALSSADKSLFLLYLFMLYISEWGGGTRQGFTFFYKTNFDPTVAASLRVPPNTICRCSIPLKAKCFIECPWFIVADVLSRTFHILLRCFKGLWSPSLSPSVSLWKTHSKKSEVTAKSWADAHKLNTACSENASLGFK